MSKDISSAITAVQAIALTVSGVRAAPSAPPGKLVVYPTVLTFEGPGEWTTPTPGVDKWLGQLVVQVHVDAGDLARAIGVLLPIGTAIPKAIHADMFGPARTTLSGSVDTIGRIISSGIIPMEYAGIKTLGYEFRISEVKIETNMS